MSVTAIATALATKGFTFDILGSAAQDIDEGGTARYNFKLTNIGQNPETLEVVVPDGPRTGWQIALQGGTDVPPGSNEYIRHEASLPAGGQLSLTLSVTSLSSASPSSTTERVDLSAFLKNDTSDKRTITTTTKLLTSGEIDLIPDVPSKTAQVKDKSASSPAYDSLDYTIRVANSGPEISLTFDVKLPSSASGWTVITPSDLTIDENDNEDVTFTVTPSSSAVANENPGYEITFEAKSKDDSQISAKTSVMAKVKQFYKLEIDVQEEKTVGGSGEEVNYALTVKNKGNGDDEVNVILSKKEWEYRWETVKSSIDISGDTLKFTLKPGSSERIALILTSPSDARNGDETKSVLIVRSFEFSTSDELTYKKFTLTAVIEKSGSDALMDALTDLWIIIVLVIAVIIIAAFIKIKLKEKDR
jgi:hypothetical protein